MHSKLRCDTRKIIPYIYVINSYDFCLPPPPPIYLFIYLFTIFYQGSPFNKSWFPIGPWDKNIYNHYKSTLYNNKKANT